ncbi:hypothetical protein ACIQCG_00800 [Streptomyces noursei]|uniref:hypothetical protein n=1 Tax=Streptomyces noursei TaxID=1971 RepID=UPI0037FCB486
MTRPLEIALAKVNTTAREVYLHRPGIAVPPQVVTTEEIADLILDTHKDFASSSGLRRFLANTGVEERRFTRPLSEVARTEYYEETNDVAVEWVHKLSVEAADQALRNAGVAREDVAAIVHCHVTGHAVPSIADRMAEDKQLLGLPRDALIVPMTELACAGGAHALAVAARLAQPGRPVLAVAAEDLSVGFQLEHDMTQQHVAFKGLFSAGGAAVVVTAEQPAERPCVEIQDTWFDRLEGSLSYYQGRFDRRGMHFDSTKQALAAIGQVVPRVPWLADGWRPQHGVFHPGSAPILDRMAEHSHLPDSGLEHALEVLRTRGNYGAPTVWEVLRRHFDDMPAPDAAGLLLGVGPGFRTTAHKVRFLS